jgi:hypothetical protein
MAQSSLYNAVPKDEPESDFEDAAAQHHIEVRKSISFLRLCMNWGWIFSTFLFAGICLLQVLQKTNCQDGRGFDVGSLTDLGRC